MSNDGARKSLMRKRASRLAAAQALYSEALIEKKTMPGLLVAQVLQSWMDSRLNDAGDLPHAIQPEQALLNRLVETAQQNAEKIETVIDAMILPDWKKSRMSLPLLSTLRACGAEAIAYPERKRATLVEEYTEVASQICSEEEVTYAHKAFNLLLDALHG